MSITKGSKTFKLNQVLNASGEIITRIDLFIKGNLVKSKILANFDVTKISYEFLNITLSTI